jgi:hypothetical protein
MDYQVILDRFLLNFLSDFTPISQTKQILIFDFQKIPLCCKGAKAFTTKDCSDFTTR